MLTRAKRLSIINGHEPTLKTNKNRKEIIKYCDENNSVLNGDLPFISNKEQNKNV